MMVFQGTIDVRSGRIRAVEPDFGFVRIIVDGKSYNFEKAWAIPGFVDSHLHLVGLGETLVGITNLQKCRSAEECGEYLRSHPSERGGWLLGRGWDHQRWEKRELPSAVILDKVFPDKPVFLLRVDGHAAWVNSAALRRVGITAATANPPGGYILRDEKGHPTGILLDEAIELVRRHIPPPSEEEVRTYIQSAAEHLVQYGITEVHDMDVDPQWIPVFQALVEQLPLRVQSYVRGQNDEWVKARLLPTTGEFFRLTGVKLFADGALGSYGAALSFPYRDRPDWTGLLLLDSEQIEERLELICEMGWDIAIHAIGDRANHLVLNWYERLRKERIADPSQRLRIEHAQIVAPEDLPRFAAFDILPSVQPVHCIDDASMAVERLGENAQYSYPWRSLRNYGSIFGAGSDAPVASPDPRLGIHAFCFRTPPDWQEPFYPQERLTAEEALLAYTEWAHQLTGMHIRRGKIREGYDADIVVLDANPLKTRDFLSLSILATFVAGHSVYVNSVVKEGSENSEGAEDNGD